MAIAQMAQTTMRNVVGKTELDDLLSNRDTVSTEIKEEIDVATDPWGLMFSRWNSKIFP